MRKGLKIFLSVLVLIVVVGLVIAAGIGSRDNVTGKWFQQPDVTKWFYSWGKDKDDRSDDNISIASYALAEEDFAAYGISENAIKAGVLTAEYTPDNTTNKRTGWTWRWAGTHSDWSTGKNIADYVKFTAGANYAPELTYEVLQAFGDTIIVEATSRANSALKATTNIDYLAKYCSIWDDNTIELNYGEDIALFTGFVEEDDCYSIVPDSFVVKTGKICLSDDAQDWMQAKHIDGVWDEYNLLSILDDTSSKISWSKLHFVGDFSGSIVADYYEETGNNYAYTVICEIACYYNGIEQYTFSVNLDMDYSLDCIQQMNVPPTNITISGGGQVIV